MNKQPSELEQKLKSLDWEIQPEKDLWPAIAAEIETSELEHSLGQADNLEQPHFSDQQVVYINKPAKAWGNYAIAASLLIAVFSVTFSFMSHQQLRDDRQQQLAVTNFQHSQLQLIEEQHKLVRSQFIALLDAKPDHLDDNYAHEVRLLMQHIDQASEELKLAIEANPNNPSYSSMLVNTYHQEAKLLKKLTYGSVASL